MPAPIPSPRVSGYTVTTTVPLYWAAYGKVGAPRLLVLHGGPGAYHDYLLPQMLALGDAYELVFYDQRGAGRSRTAPDVPVDWRAHVEDLGRLARELELEPLSLVGYSWGGLLALLYAAASYGAAPLASAAPPGAPRPLRLALIDPAPTTHGGRVAFEQAFAARQQGEPVQRLRRELASSGLRERDLDAYRQRLFELGVAGYFARPERARELTPFRVLERVQRAVWESLGDYDLRPSLAGIDVPVLIVHGRDDPIPLAAAEATARSLPDAELVVLDDSGHVPYVEAPAPLFAALRRFLARTAPTTTSST